MRPSAIRVFLALIVLGVSACRQDMHDQPKLQDFEESAFFADGRSARRSPEGTVARGELRDDELLYHGTEGGEPADRFPFPITEEVLLRGQKRFNIYCSPCHDHTGSGHGMIVERGLRPPTSFLDERLRKASPGSFFKIITEGFGAMFDYSDRIQPRDRWAIIAYIRALQLSQYAPVDELPAELRAKVEASR